MKPEISIIIPVYNRENSIGVALNSLLKQTYQNFEVVIIDDGSIDNTAEVIKENKDLKYKYIWQENSGVSSARNKGMEEASGKYICFLDSDDYNEHTFLEKMYNKIKSKNFDICYCGYYRESSLSRKKVKTLFKEGDILLDFILSKVNIHTSGWMIKKDFIESQGIMFNQDMTWGEDLDFFYRLVSKTNKICYVRDYLTNYTQDFTNNRLSSFSIEKIDQDFEFIKNLIRNKDIAKDKEIEKALIKYRLSALITYKLFNAFQNNINKEIILEYYYKYQSYINEFSFNNGLRSIKLNLYKLYILFKIEKIKR